jgi:hypothetical protein
MSKVAKAMLAPTLFKNWETGELVDWVANRDEYLAELAAEGKEFWWLTHTLTNAKLELVARGVIA